MEYPDECKESFGNIARATSRRMYRGECVGEWAELESYPVLCREWLAHETGEVITTHDNRQICQSAVWCLMLGGAEAESKFVAFLADWLWRGDTLR